MTKYLSEILTVSSEGKVSIPKAILNGLNLSEGSKLILFTDGEYILMKPVIQHGETELSCMMDETQKWAEDVGIQEADIQDAIMSVRRKKKRSSI